MCVYVYAFYCIHLSKKAETRNRAINGNCTVLYSTCTIHSSRRKIGGGMNIGSFGFKGYLPPYLSPQQREPSQTRRLENPTREEEEEDDDDEVYFVWLCCAVLCFAVLCCVYVRKGCIGWMGAFTPINGWVRGRRGSDFGEYV